jgi:hypothetical protein
LVRQAEKDATSLDPEQVMTGALGLAFRETDGEDIDMAGSDLEHMLMLVKKYRPAGVEHDAGRSRDRSLRVCRFKCPRENRVVHS